MITALAIWAAVQTFCVVFVVSLAFGAWLLPAPKNVVPFARRGPVRWESDGAA